MRLCNTLTLQHTHSALVRLCNTFILQHILYWVPATHLLCNTFIGDTLQHTHSATHYLLSPYNTLTLHWWYPATRSLCNTFTLHWWDPATHSLCNTLLGKTLQHIHSVLVRPSNTFLCDLVGTRNRCLNQACKTSWMRERDRFEVVKSFSSWILQRYSCSFLLSPNVWIYFAVCTDWGCKPGKTPDSLIGTSRWFSHAHGHAFKHQMPSHAITCHHMPCSKINETANFTWHYDVAVVQGTQCFHTIMILCINYVKNITLHILNVSFNVVVAHKGQRVHTTEPSSLTYSIL